METFPQNDTNKHSIENGLGKAVLVSAAILAGASSEAQNTKSMDTPTHSISQEKHSSQERDSATILKTIADIESSTKTQFHKTSKKDEMVYAVITESAGLRTAQFGPNNMEFALAEDLEYELTNNPNRDYVVVDRSPQALNQLLKEKELMEDVGNKKGSKSVLSTFLPADVYFTVGFKGADSTKEVTIRRIDVHTKEVTMYTIEYHLVRRDVDDGYDHLSKLVQEKIHEILSEEQKN